MRDRTVLFRALLILAVGILGLFLTLRQVVPLPQMQQRTPVDELQLHLVGVHVIKEAPDRQYVAHHYCQQLADGIIQCAVFDSAEPGAKLVDVEYVVSDAIYTSLSADEQQYWHPHDYEVEAGLLQAPELPPDQARELLNSIRSTHGRTWHLWAHKENPLPLGPPELSWSVTGPGQLREDIERELQMKHQ
ncbi:MAG: DUF1264 domain-containing protein [Chloroflexi bacterium]|nr:DUF1264 domain-containing protein [Chloroflexota bacterium]